MGYDAGDSEAEAIAGRIRVNAQRAEIPMKLQAIPNNGSAGASADARLVRLRMESAIPQVALMQFLEEVNSIAAVRLDGEAFSGLPNSASPEQIYSAESATMRTYSVVPIAWIPQVYGLSSRVRDWTAPGPGEAWPVASIWLDNVDNQPEQGKS